VLDVVPEITWGTDRLCETEKCRVILRVVWKSLDDQLAGAESICRWGIKGIKSDFMQRNDQTADQFPIQISRETAKRKMLVDFHGASKAGEHDTHLAEPDHHGRISGLEWSKLERGNRPLHTVTLPFTRMFLARWISHQVRAERAKKSFASNLDRPMSLGTRCHQFGVVVYVCMESRCRCWRQSLELTARPRMMEFRRLFPRSG